VQVPIPRPQYNSRGEKVHRPMDDFALALLDLADAERPGRRPPRHLQALLPEPMRSLDDWRRFACEDIGELSPAERRWESLRLRVAAAELEHQRVPPWIFSRLTALEAR